MCIPFGGKAQDFENNEMASTFNCFHSSNHDIGKFYADSCSTFDS